MGILMGVVTIDAHLVRRLIALQFPEWADLPITLIERGGWDNRTFRVGEHMIARLPSAARYASQVEKEQRWLPRLTPFLPVPVPVLVAMGAPAEGYPWCWSIYRWIDGEPATTASISDECAFARDLASFLGALQSIDATDGPTAGPHSFFRGGSLATYDGQTREAVALLGDGFDADRATAMWEAAIEAQSVRSPVWVHGDFAAGNLLVNKGRLCGVIDFGCLCVGDPACDLAIAWTMLGRESREVFRSGICLDDATWLRGRGWVLWKALILHTGLVEGHPYEVADAGRVLGNLLAERV
jgi:aminoglycoside phosphotransferase (APT) family kinase protein